MLLGFDGKVHRLIVSGRNREAAALLREKMRLNPKPKARHLNLLGICETLMGHHEPAREIFSQALLLSPRDSHALNNLGNLAFMENDDQTAREYYLRSLRENVWVIEPRHNLTVLYQHVGHSEKALSAYEDYVMVSRAIRWAQIAVASVFVLLLVLAFKA